jgi:hypothetical protein
MQFREIITVCLYFLHPVVLYLQSIISMVFIVLFTIAYFSYLDPSSAGLLATCLRGGGYNLPALKPATSGPNLVVPAVTENSTTQ